MRWGLALALGLAGCGSATSTHSASGSASSAVGASGPQSDGALSAVVRAVHAATGTIACRPGQIMVSTGEGGVGLGHVGLTLRFLNHSKSACTLTGYPGAAFVTTAGRQVQARRSVTGYLGGLTSSSSAVPVLRVAPAGTVSAYLEGLDSNPANGGSACPRYVRLLVTPPNQTVTVGLPSPISEICRPEVHPVVSGVDGRGS